MGGCSIRCFHRTFGRPRRSCLLSRRGGLGGISLHRAQGHGSEYPLHCAASLRVLLSQSDGERGIRRHPVHGQNPVERRTRLPGSGPRAGRDCVDKTCGPKAFKRHLSAYLDQARKPSAAPRGRARNKLRWFLRLILLLLSRTEPGHGRPKNRDRGPLRPGTTNLKNRDAVRLCVA
jgi:hypothetical protein